MFDADAVVVVENTVTTVVLYMWPTVDVIEVASRIELDACVNVVVGLATSLLELTITFCDPLELVTARFP